MHDALVDIIPAAFVLRTFASAVVPFSPMFM